MNFLIYNSRHRLIQIKYNEIMLGPNPNNMFEVMPKYFFKVKGKDHFNSKVKKYSFNSLKYWSIIMTFDRIYITKNIHTCLSPKF